MSAIHSSRCDYALRAMLELGKRMGMGPIRVTEIAEAQDAPARFLEAILADLKKAGLVESRRGVKGGYWLGRSPDQIKVAEVIRHIDGPFVGVPSDEVGRTEGGHASSSVAFRALWTDAARTLEQYYARVTIAELVAADSRARKAMGADFVI